MLIDTATNAFMQSMECPFLISVLKVIALIFDPIALVILSLVIAPYIYVKSSKKKGVFFGGVIIFTGAVILVVKEIFGRVRPFNSLVPELGFSFPSGHATIAVVFFGLLVYLFVSKKYKVHGIIVASLLVFFIGLSRVYLRVHWLTDVLGGFVLGGIILFGSILASKKI